MREARGFLHGWGLGLGLGLGLGQPGPVCVCVSAREARKCSRGAHGPAHERYRGPTAMLKRVKRGLISASARAPMTARPRRR